MLDNPIWSALCTDHAGLALGDGFARRYPPDIGPLSGIREQSAGCYESLRSLAGPAGIVAIFSVDPITPTNGWSRYFEGQLHQMICETRGAPVTPPADLELRQLATGDAAQMVALAELTEPGPFRLRTIELGTFFGVFQGPDLVAMAGKRMHLPGLVEVSGVCTHPDARGRGYARLLISLVMQEIWRDGKTPFLHVTVQNPAISLYQSLGFRIRRTMHFAALKAEDERP